MRDIYIHIDTHKTGTSSIQAFLRRNATALHRVGVYVTDVGTRHVLGGHHNIAWELRAATESRFDPVHGNIRQMLADLGHAPV